MKRRGRVRLLVSVRDAAEAAAALAGGADVIDVKEPGRGGMGRADARVVDDVVAVVKGRRPTSAALGEFKDELIEAPRGVDYVKTGLAGATATWRDDLLRRCGAALRRQLIVVAYADGELVAAPRVEAVLDWVCRHDVAGLLIDTAVKDGRTLFDHLDAIAVATMIARCREHGKLIALAGSLRGAAFEQAAALEPYIVAVRGAACAGEDRNGVIAVEQVRRLASIISACETPAAMHAG